MPQLKYRQIARVYQDPITCHKIEGKATLIDFIRYGENGLELWEVKFTDVPGSETFWRFINPSFS